jgi:hypothetical protein
MISTILYSIGFVLFSFIGGVVSRMSGGGLSLTTKDAYGNTVKRNWLVRLINTYGLEHFIFALPIIGILLVVGVVWWAAILTALLSVPLFRTGHGQWMALPYSQKILEPERLDFIVGWVFGEDPRLKSEYIPHGILDLADLPKRIEKYGRKKLEKRNLFGLAVHGSAPLIPLSVLLAYEGFYLAIVPLLLGGMLKAVGYKIGWKINYPDRTIIHTEIDEPTELGEFLRGIFLFGGYFICLLMIT